VLYFSAMLMVAGVGTGVSADIISVSLTYTNSAERPLLAASDMAGFVNAANWNQVVAPDRDSVGITADSLALNLGTGTSSGASLAHSSSGGSYVARRTTDATTYTPNQALMAGAFARFNYGTSGSHIYEVTGLSSTFTGPGYDVYVYVNAANFWEDRTDFYGQYRLQAGTYDQTTWAVTGVRYTNAFINAGSGATQGTAGTGNYILFSGLTNASFTLTGVHSTDSARSGINGFQIVAIPEPGSMLLMGLGISVIVFFRRFVNKTL